MFAALFLATVFLAYTNGANDNFKGVATLFGSRTTAYKRALGWATLTTFLGSICSLLLARALVETFSGKDIVPDAVTTSPDFVLAVALGAALTVLLATVKGLPVSTTHSITGALVGAGMAAVGTSIHWTATGRSFFLPLLLGPMLAVLLAADLYTVLRTLRRRLGITKESCLCVGETKTWVPVAELPQVSGLRGYAVTPSLGGTLQQCAQRYAECFLGIDCGRALDFAHYMSAGAASFARGLNDTPKIAALMLLIPGLQLSSAMPTLAVAMAVGGRQGFAANLVTSILVIFASHLGMPVSTTHVSVGALFGIGLINGTSRVRVISGIVASWVLTLPIATPWQLAFTWLWSSVRSPQV